MAIARARKLRQEMPRPEAIMWNALRSLKPLGIHFRRQVPLGPYYADFACHHPRLVIEIDGRTHTDPDYDAARDVFIEREGYRVLRVGNDDVLRELDGVMRAVQHALGIVEREG
jgi:very-short-patch-repair endonuclease